MLRPLWVLPVRNTTNTHQLHYHRDCHNLTIIGLLGPRRPNKSTANIHLGASCRCSSNSASEEANSSDVAYPSQDLDESWSHFYAGGADRMPRGHKDEWTNRKIGPRCAKWEAP